eukprot:g548.t1
MSTNVRWSLRKQKFVELKGRRRKGKESSELKKNVRAILEENAAVFNENSILKLDVANLTQENRRYEEDIRVLHKSVKDLEKIVNDQESTITRKNILIDSLEENIHELGLSIAECEKRLELKELEVQTALQNNNELSKTNDAIRLQVQDEVDARKNLTMQRDEAELQYVKVLSQLKNLEECYSLRGLKLDEVQFEKEMAVDQLHKKYSNVLLLRERMSEKANKVRLLVQTLRQLLDEKTEEVNLLKTKLRIQNSINDVIRDVNTIEEKEIIIEDKTSRQALGDSTVQLSAENARLHSKVAEMKFKQDIQEKLYQERRVEIDTLTREHDPARNIEEIVV